MDTPAVSDSGGIPAGQRQTLRGDAHARGKEGKENPFMKFFHLSDLHLGLRLFSRDLREDQEYILKKITEAAEREQPDAVVIAGDIYDKAVPSAESVELFDSFLTDLTKAAPGAAVMMISGNHDSAVRVNCFRNVLGRHGIHMIGMPPALPEEHIASVTLNDQYGPVHFWLLPFIKPSMVKNIVGTEDNGNNLSYAETLRRMLAREAVNTEERNVIVSHQFYLPPGKKAENIDRMGSEIPTVGNIDAVPAALLAPFDYAALGHIHKPMEAGSRTARYCGTPLACSVSEAGQLKGIILVELGEKKPAAYAGSAEGQGAKEHVFPKAEVRTTVLPLNPLRQVRVVRGTLEEVLSVPSGDYVTVILTDEAGVDAFDAREKLLNAFPYLLEIRRETSAGSGFRTGIRADALPEPLELCRMFLKDPGRETMEILEDVINTVREA